MCSTRASAFVCVRILSASGILGALTGTAAQWLAKSCWESRSLCCATIEGESLQRLRITCALFWFFVVVFLVFCVLSCFIVLYSSFSCVFCFVYHVRSLCNVSHTDSASVNCYFFVPQMRFLGNMNIPQRV